MNWLIQTFKVPGPVPGSGKLRFSSYAEGPYSLIDLQINNLTITVPQNKYV